MNYLKFMLVSFSFFINSLVYGVSDMDVYGETIARRLVSGYPISSHYLQEALEKFEQSRHIKSLKGKSLKSEYDKVCALMLSKLEEYDDENAGNVNIKKDFGELLKEIKDKEVGILFLRNVSNFM
jgi:hypothetical protein